MVKWRSTTVTSAVARSAQNRRDSEDETPVDDLSLLQFRASRPHEAGLDHCMTMLRWARKIRIGPQTEISVPHRLEVIRPWYDDRGIIKGWECSVTARERLAGELSAWFLVFGAMVLVLIMTFVLGMHRYLAMILPAGIALSVAIWAVSRLGTERAAHEAALTRWAASEAIVGERLRIARDLHDIVSHGLGMITVRAATARHLNGQVTNGKELLDAIEDVENLSRQATLELRRMLETLRQEDERAPRHPADTLASLPGIIAGAQRAGLRVELHQDELGTVSPGAQLAICAIVREGLGNSVRHAGFTRVRVDLSRTRNTISVSISDDGPSRGWAAKPGAGHGLIGLRERVSNLGGTFSARPHGTGFRLEATVPEGTR